MSALRCRLWQVLAALALCLGLQLPAFADAVWPSVIDIGIQKGDPLVALRASGELEKAFAPYGVTVKWKEFVYGAPLVEAINTGDVDVGAVGSTPPILAQAGAAPGVVYVAFAPRLQKSYGLIVPAHSPVQRIEDLKGRKIAFAKGSQGHLFVLKALADAGLPPSAVQFVYLNYSDARAAFERGFIDAWAVPDPRYADTELATGARTILTIGQLSVPQYGFYIGSREFARRYPGALRLLFDVLDRQTALELAHPTQTAEFLAQNTGVRLDVWSRALPRLEWGVRYPLTDEVVKAQQDAADLAYREHVIPRRIDVREAIIDIR
ncbi:aliphatic sulfonate ABC transporter substrate-binding protein [Paraburkholderia kururiensis]|uniref:Aliphatic sulfonate ABC transporter substrate-binding protein n=1 Tax=Paraburkholderia kururiensis TaxID=984307 RepID=A0ABZ0WJ11_9BURK|nr:aliphatic sulfonate ABC transporter substrate-binding protein [Paraburkholderia kururiensis]WQD77351.1 aliphatic sulfonate ABC transporter substrate-binding protein [Paraburkholderia kururiensis]